jgi:hypothetical protein
VKRYIDKDVWDSYFKFCFERNPYDKVISWYFWTQRNSKPMKISSFLRTEKFMKRIMAREQYCINGNNVMNHIYRFENLNDAVINISERLGLSETLELPHAKGSVRPNKSSYRDLFNADDKALVDELFKYELVQFDYQW